MANPIASVVAERPTNSAMPCVAGPSSPKVSVVIAAHNCERFIEQTIESVFAQTLKDVEVIVIDDGSTDRTGSILCHHSDPRLKVFRQKNSGVSAARNAGLAAAQAPYIFFLDADDILLPDALQRMVDVLDTMPQRVACVAHHIRIAEGGTELSSRADLPLKMFPADDTLRHLITKNFIVCGAICIRTAAARLIRGFNPALTWGEDWEFWCRLALLGDFATLRNEVALKYRQHGTSTNFHFRNSPLRPNFQAIETVFSNPAVQRRFSPAELKRRRRLAEIDAFWTCARNAFVQKRPLEFLVYLFTGAIRYPDSILRPRLVYLFIRALQLKA